MTIKINVPKEEGEGRMRFTLPVPLGLLNIPFIWRFLPPEQQKYQSMARELVKALKQFKKQNGSWNLVEVDSKEEGLVRIRI